MVSCRALPTQGKVVGGSLSWRGKGGAVKGSLGKGMLMRPSNPYPVQDKNGSFCYLVKGKRC